MEKNQFSRTALGAAYARGYHAVCDEPKIFDDFMAFSLLPEGFRANTERQRAMRLFQLDPEQAASCLTQDAALAYWMQNWASTSMIISRARYAEDILAKAVEQGVKQYVILGAGLDTFAFRRTDMLEQLQVFEVDHPSTQALKRHRLSELGWEIPKQVHFVSVDFTLEGLVEALDRSSYDPKVLSLFSWLGVTYYLPRQAVYNTLREISDVAPMGSTVVFDYSDEKAIISEKEAKRLRYLYAATNRIGEQLMTSFDASTLSREISGLGLRIEDDLGCSDIEERYFRGRKDRYHASERSHFACAVVI
jgi:methyltransferase (TIGR00027 family)